MNSETKTPKSNEWWHYNGVRIRIVGVLLNGNLVCEYKDGSTLTLTQGDYWHHEPRCDSFDWVEPSAADPGEWYAFLPVGAVLQDGDQYECSDGKWKKTQAVGRHVSSKSVGTYRRKKPPAEVWPKWYVGNNWRDEDAYVRVDSETSQGVWVDSSGCVVKTLGRYGYLYVKDNLVSWSWREVTESEALARVTPPEPVESPEDWVTQDRVPARIGKDQFNWGGFIHWNEVRQMHIDEYGVELRHGWVDPDDDAVAHVRCRRKDLPVPVPVPTRIQDNRPARDVIMDLMDWLNPKREAGPNADMAFETAEQWLIDNPVKPQEFCTCPTIDGIQVTGSACPVHGFSSCELTPDVKRVPVRLWRMHCTGVVEATIDPVDDPDPIDLSEEADQILHDAGGFYVEVPE